MTYRDYNSFPITIKTLAYIFSHITRKNTGHSTDCWLWVRLDGTESRRDKYNFLWSKNKAYLAHRIMYALFVEFVHTDNVIDHLCRTPSCINPVHLEQVTFKENALRGVGLPAQNARKTHCQNGHELTEDNIYWEQGVSRKCRLCRTANSFARRRRNGRKIRSKTHCPQGHEFTPSNSCIDKHGARRCRTCYNARARTRRAKQKQMLNI